MKNPRVEDFDPKAATRLKSSFDDMPPILPPERRVQSDGAPTQPEAHVPASQKPGNPGMRQPVMPGLREPGKPETREPGNPTLREAGTPGTRDAVNPGPDFTQVPLRKETFMFTHEESDELEDAKINLRRRFDVRTTKNDIARVAVQAAIADYKKRGEQSTLVHILRKKRAG
jgi:hypothetical protein